MGLGAPTTMGTGGISSSVAEMQEAYLMSRLAAVGGMGLPALHPAMVEMMQAGMMMPPRWVGPRADGGRFWSDRAADRRGGRGGRGRGGRGMRERDRERHEGDAVSEEASSGPRSYVLESFRENKHIKLELGDIQGLVCEFARDQHGSRLVQQKLELAGNDQKDAVFEEILVECDELMVHVFGNYVIQKFLDHGTLRHVEVLTKRLKGRVLDLSLQMYGCRVVQKAIEVLSGSTRRELVLELRGHVLQCVEDPNGNHVIQKCIEQVELDSLGFLLASFDGQVKHLASHPYGCRVIQRVLEHAARAAEAQPIVTEILQHVPELVEDQYGNYVVQHVLEHCTQPQRHAVVHHLLGNVLKYSQQKFASNVVERSLQFSAPPDRRSLIDEMIATPTGRSVPAMDAMMKDPFANYVIQKVLSVAEPDQRQKVVDYVQEEARNLRRYTYGKHILSTVERLTGKPLP